VGLVIALFAIPAVVAFVLVRPSGQATATPSPFVSAYPATTGPGIEPPKQGDWPASWATFAEGDRRKPMSGLEGLGFSFDVPEGWGCVKAVQEDNGVTYRCGANYGTAGEIGGDVTVRVCPGGQCDARTRTTMRGAVEAWGLQWTRADYLLVWAETTQFLGSPRYGLAVVGYWRSVRDGAIDRQVVVRMTAAPDGVAQIQKVVNSIRSGMRYGQPDRA
jgi:hypothetical protein